MKIIKYLLYTILILFYILFSWACCYNTVEDGRDYFKSILVVLLPFIIYFIARSYKKNKIKKMLFPPLLICGIFYIADIADKELLSLNRKNEEIEQKQRAKAEAKREKELDKQIEHIFERMDKEGIQDGIKKEQKRIQDSIDIVEKIRKKELLKEKRREYLSTTHYLFYGISLGMPIKKFNVLCRKDIEYLDYKLVGYEDRKGKLFSITLKRKYLLYKPSGFDDRWGYHQAAVKGYEKALDEYGYELANKQEYNLYRYTEKEQDGIRIYVKLFSKYSF